MALNPWEFSYNGLTFGGSQPFGITQIDGLSPPNARVDEVEKQGDHGSYLFAQYLEARTVTITGDILGTDATDFETKVTQLRAAFAPQSVALPLQMAISGGVQKRLLCIPTKVDFPIDVLYGATFYDAWTVELMAEDPRIYSDTLNAYNLSNYAPNGIGFNIAFNVNFGGVTGGGNVQSLVNAGSFPTLPLVTIYGPATNPQVRNITTGQQLTLNITMSPTEYMVMDFAARTLMLNGTSSRYSSFTTGSKWWPLIPGGNTVQFIATNTGGSTLATIQYRDAWN